ncbi:TetR/AcrR family transcriptional regulator [Thermococcus sp.]|uniref:TetR/AcrR family transcriptional regulator n=1 Tax=Thermococcus sp. TaxID=35749 RepID=UPI002609E7F9|nr:TetR/AcrR family transcriptional regulator [Thermococcus sp.]
MKTPGRTRDKIVSAALELFANKGFDKTTVDEIVNRAGVAKGTFYLYFKSKDDLVKEVAVDAMPIVAFPSLQDPYITVSYPTLREFLLALGREFMEFYDRNYRREIFFSLLTLRKRSESLNLLYHESCSELLRTGARRIMVYTKVGFAQALIAFQVFLGSLLHYLHARECVGFSDEEYLNHVVDVVTSYLKLSAEI